MSSISSNQLITINRGDTFGFNFFINCRTQMNPMRYPFNDNDTIYVGVMEANQPFENAIIRKVYKKEDLNQYGDIRIQFNPEDTENLLTGTYYYSIKLERKYEDGSSQVVTLVPKRKFFVVE